MNQKVRSFLFKNNVTVLFVILCIACFLVSDYTLTSLSAELFTRIGRNTFMILSLVIPVVAGLGLNFGIVIGAVAAQIAIFFVVHWGFSGFSGFILCMVIATPLAILFGYLVGRLFNSMKGTEMIGGLVAGYFSDGLYQLLFLTILGGVIPIYNKTLMISTGVGVKNVINLEGNIKYALDNVPILNILDFAFWASLVISILFIVYQLIKKKDLQIVKVLKFFVPVALLYGISFIPSVTKFMSSTRLLLLHAVELGIAITIIYQVVKIIKEKVIEKTPGLPVRKLIYIGIAVLVYGATYIPALYEVLLAVHLPVLTYMFILGLCMLIPWFMNTKLGQDMRTVGQNREVAISSGIDVNKIRIIAMIMSTVLASYGQLISLQNIGTMATYGSHQQVGLYAIAALLVGGASVHRATTKQAVLGVILFHTLFILSPNAGKALIGNAQIGEYFRVFVSYGVIALALAMHAWKPSDKKKIKG